MQNTLISKMMQIIDEELLIVLEKLVIMYEFRGRLF